MVDWFFTGRARVVSSGNECVHGCAVMGWVRKDAYRVTPGRSQQELQDAIVGIGTDPRAMDATSHGIEGIPLFWSGEVKNRCQLYRLARCDRTGKLTIYSAPDLSGLVLSPVLGSRHVVALRGKTVLSCSRLPLCPSRFCRRWASDGATGRLYAPG